ncbi:unnamed protein product [Ilex paraguariensis]|uniref:SGTA homodimerisation domain-containing protein n=1 Tax=Ilex paraguariensis TaxID=185542 RepID=A0ABC8UI26_9AQUA
MEKLKTDSPLSRRIVLSFLDFLDSVEAAPGVDVEGLEVAKECLAEVFQIDPSSVDSLPKVDSLIDIFSSPEATEWHEIKSDLSHDYQGFSADAPCSSSTQNAIDAGFAEAPKPMVHASATPLSLYNSSILLFFVILKTYSY